MKKRFLLAGLVLGGGLAVQAMSLTESTFTEVIKDVNVVSQATKAAQPARVKDIVKAPDLVRTGPDSRAELTAPDQTITRIGANAVFSFEPAGRKIDLQQGSILFHSPSGKGGGGGAGHDDYRGGHAQRWLQNHRAGRQRQSDPAERQDRAFERRAIGLCAAGPERFWPLARHQSGQTGGRFAARKRVFHRPEERRVGKECRSR